MQNIQYNTIFMNLLSNIEKEKLIFLKDLLHYMKCFVEHYIELYKTC